MQERTSNIMQTFIKYHGFTIQLPSTNFETFHVIWEEMIRYVRHQERFEKIQLGEVYRIETREYSNYKNSILSSVVDAKSELTSIQFPDSIKNKHLPVQLNTIINSTNKRYVLPVYSK